MEDTFSSAAFFVIRIQFFIFSPTFLVSFPSLVLAVKMVIYWQISTYDS